jgi:serine/threonine protein kinase
MGTVHLVKDRLGGLVALKRLGTARELRAWSASMVEDQPRRRASLGSISPEAPTRVSNTPAVPQPVTSRPHPPDPPYTPASADAPPAAAIASTLWQVTSEGHTAPNRAIDSSILVRTGDARNDEMAEILRLTLAREFHLLASLRHPNIISVLDYGFDDDLSPYFTMELLEGAESIMTAAAGRSLDDKLDLLAQTLQALAYLHRRGVIHRDLKPGNVMVVGGRVKVLDFGVSTVRERRHERAGLIVGTLAYMAPELLQGAPASEASDLYAIGTIAYELFAGRHPFDLTDICRLRDDIVHRPPDLGPLDPRLAPVVGQLLEKRPDFRQDSVDEVFADLAARTGRPLVVETAATRESFLQAAELVGRDAELGELSAMLGAAMAGKGGGALVGGESGVGKSRLLDELRARALVDGMVVLRGQAVSAGGGPYHVYREVLRGMVLRTELDDFQAGVLEAVVPDLGVLLERAVPQRAEIDPEAAQTRLLSVIEDVFRRQEAPVLVILEDLHWAGSESLRLLTRLAALAIDLPVLFVGSYRDDERADLPRELPRMRVLKLGRLTGEGIAALAASMLGDAGRRPEVIDRLRRETEGNPFFLVEVVRALAQEAGALSRVGVEPMPATLPAGNLHLIVRRRLDQVPRHARPLLEAAAVIGRQLDPALLRRLAPDQGSAGLEAWIRACANVAVLDFAEGGYRFAHDKLREGLLAALTIEGRRALHRRVAQAIEAEYGDAPEQTMALAHHWALAGDMENEARYSALAGEQALQSSAYGDAAAFFERAIAIVSASAELGSRRRGVLGRALAAARSVVPLAPKTVTTDSVRFLLARWEGRLSEAYGGMANHAEAIHHGELALAYLGRPMPSGRAGLLAGLPVQAALRGLMALSPQAFAEPSSDGRVVLSEATRIQARVTEASFYTQESLPLLWSGLSTLNLGEPAGPSASLARGYALMAAAAGVIPLHRMAEACSRRALELVESVGKPYDIAFVLQVASSYRLWMGDWDAAEAGFKREVDYAEHVGDQRLLGTAISCLSFGLVYQGRFVRAGEQIAARRARLPLSADPEILAGERILVAGIELRRGDVVRALALCREAQPMIDAAALSHGIIRCYGMLALAQLRAGDQVLARQAADRALAMLAATRPVAYWTFDGIAAVAEAALSLWESSGASSDAERSRQACKAARAYASVFPIGRPFALLWEGLLAQLSLTPRKARKTWERCIAEAEHLRMPYERGRALFEIGRHLSPGDPLRRRHLARAAAIFAELGAEHDGARAETEIAPLTARPGR